MCEATVYMVDNDSEEKIFENLDQFEIEGDQVRMVSIFGEEKTVQARIRTFSLVDHRIVLESI